MANGVEYEVDCIIFATGFEVSRATYTHQAELEIFGRDGVKLGDYWKDGMRTYQGFMAHGFPNCYHMGFTQTGYTPNFTYMLDNQAKHLAKLFVDLKKHGKAAIEKFCAAYIQPDRIRFEVRQTLTSGPACVNVGTIFAKGFDGRFAWNEVINVYEVNAAGKITLLRSYWDYEANQKTPF